MPEDLCSLVWRRCLDNTPQPPSRRWLLYTMTHWYSKRVALIVWGSKERCQVSQLLITISQLLCGSDWTQAHKLIDFSSSVFGACRMSIVVLGLSAGIRIGTRVRKASPRVFRRPCVLLHICSHRCRTAGRHAAAAACTRITPIRET